MTVYSFFAYGIGFNQVSSLTVPALVMQVLDDDLIFDDENNGSGQTFDNSQQNLAAAIGSGQLGQAAEAVFKWNVTNVTTGQVGNAHLIRIYNQPHTPGSTGQGGQNGDFYQAFTIPVQLGDVLSYSAADFVGQVAYSALVGPNVSPGSPSISQLIDDVPLYTTNILAGGVTNDSTPGVVISLASTNAAAGDTLTLLLDGGSIAFATLTTTNIAAGEDVGRVKRDVVDQLANAGRAR
jgi:hypothetical protein